MQKTAGIFDKVSFIGLKDALKILLVLVIIVFAIVFNAALPDAYPSESFSTDSVEYTDYGDAVSSDSEEDSGPQNTGIYAIFLRVLLVVYLIFAMLSIWFANVRNRVVHLWGLLAVFFVFLTLWTWFTAKTGTWELPYLPSPNEIISIVFDDSERYLENFKESMLLYLQGVFWGAVAAMVYGTLMGYTRFFNYWLTPIIKAIGPVPGTAWLAVAIVVAPSNHMASVFLVSLSTWFPMSVNLAGGIQSVDKTYIEHAQIMGASHFYILRHVIYPAVIPNIFTGLFMGLCFSLTSLISAESLGVQAGFGWFISYAQQWMRYDYIFSIIIIFILIATIMISLLFVVQKRVMRWSKGTIQW